MFANFNEYLNESSKSKSRFGMLLENNHKDAMKRCAELVIDTLLFADKIHIWHLTCDTDKQHTTLNAIYDKTRYFADKLAETLIGEGESIGIKNKSADFTPFNENEAYEEIKKFADSLNDIAINPLDYTVAISDITKGYITDIIHELGVASFK